MPNCPGGHTSAAADYCDVCGAPITAARKPVWVATITADHDFYQRVLAGAAPIQSSSPSSSPNAGSPCATRL